MVTVTKKVERNKKYLLMDYKSAEGICVPMNYEKYKKRETEIITNEFYTGVFSQRVLKRRIDSYRFSSYTDQNSDNEENIEEAVDYDLLEYNQKFEDITDEEDDYLENYQYN